MLGERNSGDAIVYPSSYWDLTDTDWEEIRVRGTTEFGMQGCQDPCLVLVQASHRAKFLCKVVSRLL